LEKQISLQENLNAFEKKQIVISILGLVILMCISIVANRLFMRAAAEQTSRLITRMVQTDDFREVNLTLQDARLDYFSKIQYNSKSLNRSFTFPPLAEYVKEVSIIDKITSEKIQIRPPSMGTSSGQDLIEFEYNRFGFVGYAIGIWIILILVSVPQTRLIKNRIVKQFQKDLELQKKSAHAEVSRKVRHNINTPLSALIAMTERLGRLEKDDQALFQSIVNQIKSLVKDLDTAERSPENVVQGSVAEIQSVFKTLEDGFFENSLAFKNKFEISYDVDSTLLSANVKFVPHELRSIIANLVQNAVDASTEGSKICIDAQDLSNQVKITVKDFGSGIPVELIDKVTEKNVSFGKVGGTGLGLYHAKTLITEWGGTLKIESTVSVGTEVIITLPIESRAKWFTPRIKVRADQKIVLLDDQDLQHLQWDIRLEETEFKGERYFFKNSKDFLKFKEKHIADETAPSFIFLFDNHLNEDIQGIELLTALPGTSARYLITSDATDLKIQKVCTESKIFLLSKRDMVKTPLISLPALA